MEFGQNLSNVPRVSAISKGHQNNDLKPIKIKLISKNSISGFRVNLQTIIIVNSIPGKKVKVIKICKKSPKGYVLSVSQLVGGGG